MQNNETFLRNSVFQIKKGTTASKRRFIDLKKKDSTRYKAQVPLFAAYICDTDREIAAS